MQTKMCDATRLARDVAREERVEPDAVLVSIIAAQEREANEVDRAALSRRCFWIRRMTAIVLTGMRCGVGAASAHAIWIGFLPPEPLLSAQRGRKHDRIKSAQHLLPSLPQICASNERDRAVAHAQSISAKPCTFVELCRRARTLVTAVLQEAVPADVVLQSAPHQLPKCSCATRSTRVPQIVQEAIARRRVHISASRARGRRVITRKAIAEHADVDDEPSYSEITYDHQSCTHHVPSAESTHTLGDRAPAKQEGRDRIHFRSERRSSDARVRAAALPSSSCRCRSAHQRASVASRKRSAAVGALCFSCLGEVERRKRHHHFSVKSSSRTSSSLRNSTISEHVISGLTAQTIESGKLPPLFSRLPDVRPAT